MRKHYKSDSIEIKFTGGDASAGNGAKGYNSGDITNTANMTINPYNKAEGGDVHTNTGDQVDQKAGWDPTTQTADSNSFGQQYLWQRGCQRIGHSDKHDLGQPEPIRVGRHWWRRRR